MIYPAAAIAAAGLDGLWLRLRAPSVVLGGAITALVYAQAVFGLLPLPARLDPTARLLGGWPGFAQALAGTAHEQDAAFVAVEQYGDAAELARLAPSEPSRARRRCALAQFRPAQCRRNRHRTQRPAAARGQPHRPAGRLRLGSDHPSFPTWTARRGVVDERYRLYRVTGRMGDEPLAVLPRPR